MPPPEPTKYVAIRKETVQLEHEARRNYSKRWQPLRVTENYKFYNPDAVNAEINEQLAKEELAKNASTLKVEKCRCGREQTGIHLLRCLQKEKSKCPELTEDKAATDGPQPTDSKSIPKTSNAFIGWKNERRDYQMWEHSMKYMSPVLTMPGPRITATPYNVLFIG